MGNNKAFFISDDFKTAIVMDTIKCIKFMKLSRTTDINTLVVDDNIMGKLEPGYSTTQFLHILFNYIDQNVTADFNSIAERVKTRKEMEDKDNE